MTSGSEEVKPCGHDPECFGQYGDGEGFSCVVCKQDLIKTLKTDLATAQTVITGMVVLQKALAEAERRNQELETLLRNEEQIELQGCIDLAKENSRLAEALKDVLTHGNPEKGWEALKGIVTSNATSGSTTIPEDNLRGEGEFVCACKEPDPWFDRTICLRANGYMGMADICNSCGKEVLSKEPLEGEKP